MLMEKKRVMKKQRRATRRKKGLFIVGDWCRSTNIWLAESLEVEAK
jgi:hypothetical protein